jgi:hypothetical protein
MVSCPITVVKTRMEYVRAAGVGGTVPQYTSTLHALRSIARVEGVAGLYRGLAPTMLSNAPFSALYYMFYTRLQVCGGRLWGGLRVDCPTRPFLHVLRVAAMGLGSQIVAAALLQLSMGALGEVGRGMGVWPMPRGAAP